MGAGWAHRVNPLDFKPGPPIFFQVAVGFHPRRPLVYRLVLVAEVTASQAKLHLVHGSGAFSCLILAWCGEGELIVGLGNTAKYQPTVSRHGIDGEE
ncbi:MAG: hypothetical protein CV090_06495, partial [Nitrospira sp. WS238]|nr:hypothetical protein [Nitrospira sp. WS238]